MKNAVLSLCTLLLCAGAHACAVKDGVVARHGITVAGFLHDIPRAAHPPEPQLLAIPLPDNALVSDRFTHVLHLDRARKQAWVLRTGGLAGVREWYGPIDARPWSMEGCEHQGKNADDTSALRLQPVPALPASAQALPKSKGLL